jgi:hypothetical protein
VRLSPSLPSSPSDLLLFSLSPPSPPRTKKKKNRFNIIRCHFSDDSVRTRIAFDGKLRIIKSSALHPRPLSSYEADEIMRSDRYKNAMRVLFVIQKFELRLHWTNPGASEYAFTMKSKRMDLSRALDARADCMRSHSCAMSAWDRDRALVALVEDIFTVWCLGMVAANESMRMSCPCTPRLDGGSRPRTYEFLPGRTMWP